jgi:NAD(P)-dependent dehydrogenase (short-subunit alcohol dehydrogenase family)
MPSILLTGSNRGLGLELARQYAEAGWRVFATCRHPAEAQDLRRLADQHPRISIHRLDITLVEDIRAIADELFDTSIDVLFNNAGVYLETDDDIPALGGLRYDDWLRTFEVNTLGAVRVTEALRDNVARSDRRLVAVMTSHMGSIADIDEKGSYYYRSSKAALNAAMRGIAVALRPQGIGVLLLHPGAVRTRMSATGIGTKESVEGLRRQIDRFTLEDSGTFVRYDGSALPW